MTKKSDDKSFGQKLEEVTLGAIGVGIGLSAAYKSGGSEILSKGIRKASKLYNEIDKDISNKALKDIDFSSLLDKHLLNSNSTWNKLKNTPNTIEFDNNSKDLFNAFKEYINFEKNPRQILDKIYDSHLSTKIKTELSNVYAKGDTELENKIYNFVEDVKSNFDEITEKILDKDGNPILNEERLGKAFTGTNIALEDQIAMFNKIVSDFEKGNSESFANSDEGRELISNIKNTFFDYDTLQKKFGAKGSETGSQKFMNKVLDNAATLNDVLDERNEEKLKGFKQFFNGSDGAEEVDLIEKLKDFVDKNPEYGDLYVGGSYKKNKNGEVYSLKDAKKVYDNIMDEFQTTIPGKLLKLRDPLQNANAPFYRIWTEGEHDFVLGELDKEFGKVKKKSNTILNNDYIKIHDKVYRINGSDLSHVSELDNTYLISGQHGTEIRLMKDIAGDTDYLAKESNKFKKRLDIFTSTEPTKISEIKSFATKFVDPEWDRNVVNSFLYADTKNLSDNLNDKKYVLNFFSRTRSLNKFFANTTNKIDKITASKLKDLTHGSAKRAFELLELNDDEMLNKLSVMINNPNTIINPDLTSLIKKYINNPKKAMDTMNIKRDKWIMGGTTAYHFSDIVRKELAKEGFLQHVYKLNNGRLNSLYELMNETEIKGNKLKEIKHLANWGLFQKASNSYHFGIKQKNKMPSIDMLKNIMLETQQLFSLDDKRFDGEFIRDFRNNLKSMARDKSPITERGILARDKEIIEGNKYGNWTLMRKRVTLMDTIKNLNDKEKSKAYFRQWTAGRSNMKDVTTATLFPYFSVIRLVDPLAQVGLGFSANSTGSVTDLAWNIGMRRILPIMAATTAYSYLDYRSKAYTGTSITGAFANSIANTDLLGRKIGDAIGLTSRLKEARETNVISQYLSNNRPYMNYDERKQYYESGYTPVRSGRWWSFGSSSEWRGGKIDYYQPNFLIRAHSDWYDNSVYGSTDEKWKHSWIPTFRHPLSPLRALIDPYWLEKKHYWDRPYAITGKMFEENTPWGSLLNSTVGSIMKPQRRMHKSELTNGMIDVRDIIEQRNRHTMQMAKDNSSLVRINENYNVEPISFTPLSSPEGNRIFTNYRNGQVNINGGGYSYNADTLENYYNSSTFNASKIQTVKDNINFKADEGSLIAQAVRAIAPFNVSNRSTLNQLSKMNNYTFARAKQPKGSITSDPIFNYRAKDTMNILYDQEALSDLKNTGNGKEILQDGLYSAKEILGMYGFMIDSIVPHNKQYRLANAKDINSYAKKFWDNAIGGYGGEFMEIARRFFPHEDHDLEKVNPLRNTMPDWMPDRFKHGDPYTSLPKGDMRLPGKGYESIYAIHPDQFGRYGAYDRMKILADIAPWSREYKLWRDISSKTIQDPILRKQMDNIRQRVIQQSKKHDFYNYRFIGSNKLNSEKAIINKIISSNEFTVIGSNKVYKMAGIKLKQDENGNALNKYLKPGTEVMLKTNSNVYAENRNKTTKSINAAVFAHGENINRKILKDGAAENDADESPVSIIAKYGNHGITRGKFFEAIGHAPIPFVHNKFMRIETPLESWKRSQMYGKSYATWGHPIKGFIMPSLQTQWSYGLGLQAMSIASFYLAEQIGKVSSKGVKTLAYGAASLLNPAAVMGATVGFATKLNGQNLLKGARIGQAIGMAGYAYTHLDKPIDSAITFAALGSWVTKNIIKNKNITEGKGAVIGAGIGITLSSLKNPRFNKEKMFGAYIPNDRRKQWELEEYYDRLKYVKYTGLYNKAARQALLKEHVNIKKIMNQLEVQRKNMQKKQNELLVKANKISNIYSENDVRREYYLNKIYKEIDSFKTQQKILKAGKYAKSAIAYKFAADSTIYGLKENATWSQILRALPKNNRDYFLEFAKENDPKKRKEILKYISPYQKKVLKIAWGQKYKEEKSNYSYFKKKFLPGTFWSGWQPDVNLDNVEIKEIKNEGLMLSDFGFYESQANSVEAKKAPEIDDNTEQSVLAMQKNIITVLNGAGLTGVDVSIEPSEKPGIQMVANILKSNSYQLKSKINKAIGNPFYN